MVVAAILKVHRPWANMFKIQCVHANHKFNDNIFLALRSRHELKKFQKPGKILYRKSAIKPLLSNKAPPLIY